MTQQTERDEALIAEAWNNLPYGRRPPRDCIELAAEVLRLERLRGDEPAKPDRYLEIWREANAAYWSDLHQEPTVRESDQAAAAVLRRHFEPPSEVVEAARMVKAHYSGGAYPHSITLADFILKGDQ